MGCGSSKVRVGDAEITIEDGATVDMFEKLNVPSEFGVKGGPSPREVCEAAIAVMREKGHEVAPLEIKSLIENLAKADWSIISSGAYPFADVYVCARGSITVISVVSQVESPISCAPKCPGDTLVATQGGYAEMKSGSFGCVAPAGGLSCMVVAGPKPKSLIIDMDENVPQQEMGSDDLKKYLAECNLEEETTARALLSLGAPFLDLVVAEGAEHTLKGVSGPNLEVKLLTPRAGIDAYVFTNKSDKSLGVTGRIQVSSGTCWPIYYTGECTDCQLVYEPSREKGKATKQFELRANIQPGKRVLLGALNSKITFTTSTEVKIFHATEVQA